MGFSKALQFNRTKLIRDLDILRPLSGSKIKPIYNYVRFTVIASADGKSASVYLYSTNGQNFLCVSHSVINGEFEANDQFHFIINIEKLVKICKSSSVENIMIRQIQEENANQDAKYEIKTEARNQISSLSIESFPDEDFSNIDILAEYPAGFFNTIWEKSSIAKGELDIKRTCMHYDGNFITIDQSFACVAISNIPMVQQAKFSINLETGVSEVFKKMVGIVKIGKSKEGGKFVALDEGSGIFISIIPVQPQSIDYKKILEKYEYGNKAVVTTESLKSCINRARAFVDRNLTNAIKISIKKVDTQWLMNISTIEDSSSQKFEETIVLDECNAELDAAYNSENLLKSFDALSSNKMIFSWRSKGITVDDKTVLIKEDQKDYTINAIIPQMVIAR